MAKVLTPDRERLPLIWSHDFTPIGLRPRLDLQLFEGALGAGGGAAGEGNPGAGAGGAAGGGEGGSSEGEIEGEEVPAGLTLEQYKSELAKARRQAAAYRGGKSAAEQRAQALQTERDSLATFKAESERAALTEQNKWKEAFELEKTAREKVEADRKADATAAAIKSKTRTLIAAAKEAGMIKPTLIDKFVPVDGLPDDDDALEARILVEMNKLKKDNDFLFSKVTDGDEGTPGRSRPADQSPTSRSNDGIDYRNASADAFSKKLAELMPARL